MRLELLITLFLAGFIIVESKYHIPKPKESIPYSKPWLLMVLRKPLRIPFGTPHVCGATLIRVPYLDDSSDIALTAAHCIGLTRFGFNGYCHGRKNMLIGLQVIAAKHSRNEKDPFEESRDVIDGDCHKGWIYANFTNDVGILKLDKPIKFTDKIQPITLAGKYERLTPGTICNVAGWGALEIAFGNFVTAKALNEQNVTILDDKECLKRDKWYKAKENYCEERTDKAKGGSACDGDSGGALICEKAGKPVQYGIISGGNDGCTLKTNAVIHVDVGSYRDWIDKEVKKLSPK